MIEALLQLVVVLVNKTELAFKKLGLVDLKVGQVVEEQVVDQEATAEMIEEEMIEKEMIEERKIEEEMI